MCAPFVWFDLTTTTSGDDGAGVRDFYGQLFGWTIGPGMGDYQGFATEGEQPWAGILPADAASAGRWIPYVVVDDLDAATKHLVDCGATVIEETRASPGIDLLFLADPDGVRVELMALPS